MTKAKILEYVGRIILIAVGVAAFWFWSNAQVEKRVKAECALQHANQSIEKMEIEKQEVHNVDIKKAAIYSKPNDKRDSLLNKMRAGQL